MVIGGAGGHALEVLEELEKVKSWNEVVFYVDPEFGQNYSYPVIQDKDNLKLNFKYDPFYSIGVGSPLLRKKFFIMFENLGGTYFPIHAKTAQISKSAVGEFDAMAFAFVGPKTVLGKGVLINTRAHVHHECVIGDFSEISPGAIVLGGAKVGNMCRIGAGSVILPGLILGDNVVVGAGAVVTKNTAENQTVIGVPAVSIGNK